MGIRVSTQLARFVVVGVLSNLLIYLLYLVLTSVGLDYRVALTISYAVGVIQAFIFNRNWSFKHRGKARYSILRYVIAYLAGYVLNFGLLVLFVERFGIAHQLVQIVLIFVFAGVFFLAQRHWVFPQ